mgnify:CR=1 FL=1
MQTKPPGRQVHVSGPTQKLDLDKHNASHIQICLFEGICEIMTGEDTIVCTSNPDWIHKDHIHDWVDCDRNCVYTFTVWDINGDEWRGGCWKIIDYRTVHSVVQLTGVHR